MPGPFPSLQKSLRNEVVQIQITRNLLYLTALTELMIQDLMHMEN